MNKIFLMGRLTRDPEVRYSQTGETQNTVAKFSLAVGRKLKREGEPETDFFNCVTFGKQAEFVERYLKKGSKILVTGHVENDNYTNKEGAKVYNVQVILEEIEFAESKQTSQEGTAKTPQQAPKEPTNAPSEQETYFS